MTYWPCIPVGTGHRFRSSQTLNETLSIQYDIFVFFRLPQLIMVSAWSPISMVETQQCPAQSPSRKKKNDDCFLTRHGLTGLCGPQECTAPGSYRYFRSTELIQIVILTHLTPAFLYILDIHFATAGKNVFLGKKRSITPPYTRDVAPYRSDITKMGTVSCFATAENNVFLGDTRSIIPPLHTRFYFVLFWKQKNGNDVLSATICFFLQHRSALELSSEHNESPVEKSRLSEHHILKVDYYITHRDILTCLRSRRFFRTLHKNPFPYLTPYLFRRLWRPSTSQLSYRFLATV